MGGQGTEGGGSWWSPRPEEPEPGAKWQDPGFQHAGAETGAYAGDAFGQLVGGAYLGPGGDTVVGAAGREAGEWIGGGLGAAADAMFGYYTPADGHGEMCTPGQGAGMSISPGASADADRVSPGMSVNTDAHPGTSYDPGMSHDDSSAPSHDYSSYDHH